MLTSWILSTDKVNFIDRLKFKHNIEPSSGLNSFSIVITDIAGSNSLFIKIQHKKKSAGSHIECIS